MTWLRARQLARLIIVILLVSEIADSEKMRLIVRKLE